MRSTRSATPGPFRALCILLFCLACVSVLGGGSCYYSSNHSRCDDDDDTNDSGCDDDNDFEATAADSPALPTWVIRNELDGLAAGRPGTVWTTDGSLLGEPLRFTRTASASVALDSYELDLTDEPGRHPRLRVRDIRGLTAFDAQATGILSPSDFARFSALVLAGNDDLIGLPPAAGQLVPRSVHFLDQIIVAVFQQVPRGAEFSSSDWEDGQSLFVYDLLGRLLQIENQTRLPPGVFAARPAAAPDSGAPDSGAPPR
jgi:hypothetical protein